MPLNELAIKHKKPGEKPLICNIPEGGFSDKKNVYTFLEKLILALIIIISGFSTAVFGNTGIFSGSGSQIIPIKDEDIQLKSETVEFLFSVPPNSGKWGTPFIPLCKVNAEFELVNHQNITKQLQVGFPFLDLQGFGHEETVLQKINFTVMSGKEKPNVTLKEGLIEAKLDPNNLFKKVFAWDEKFSGNEHKNIKVSYALEMSAGAYPSDISENIRFSEAKITGLIYSFYYITKTAYTWRAPIEKAEFIAHLGEITQALKNPDNFKIPEFINIKKPNSRPLIILELSPTTQRDGDFVKWIFREKIPEDGIGFYLSILDLPIDLADFNALLAEKKQTLNKEGYTVFIKNIKPLYEEAKTKIYFEEDGKQLPEIIKLLDEAKD